MLREDHAGYPLTACTRAIFSRPDARDHRSAEKVAASSINEETKWAE
jgi:hypothetical protein